jgi:uncharacterized membrane protein YgcG
MSTETTPAMDQDTRLSRRKMLMRLGLAATAAYAAPTMLQLGEAKASGFSGGRRSGGGRRSFSGRRKGGRRRSFSR